MPQQQAQQIIATPWSYSYKSNNQKTKNNNNKQTNKQEEVRIYSSRKKKNEEKTNLELLFSSKLLFCSVLFCSVLLSSIFFLFLLLVFCWSSFPSLLLSPQLLAIQKSKKIAKLLLCPSTGGPEIAMHFHFHFLLTTKQQETGSWKPWKKPRAQREQMELGKLSWTKNPEAKKKEKLEWRWRWRWFFFFVFVFFFFFKGLKMQGISFMANY